MRGRRQPVGRDVHAPARRVGHRYATVSDRVRRLDEQPLLPRIIIRAFDGKLQILAGVGNRAQQMHGEQCDQRQVGAMRRARHGMRFRCLRDLQRAR